MVPLHPEAVPGCADRLRWVVPAGTLPFAGSVATAPPALDVLLTAGVLSSVEVEPAAVVTTLGPGRCWRDVGARVRTALHTALGDPGGWRPGEEARALDDDGVLGALAARVIDGPAGDFVRSHGGGVELVGAYAGVVEVRLSGACRGCPAIGLTLSGRLERALRAEYPALRELRAVG